MSSDPAAGVDLTDWYCRFGSDSEVYRVTSRTTTAFTLDAVYVNDTATAATVKLFKLRYDVGSSDILKYLGPIRIYGKNRNSSLITITDKEEMMNQYPLYNVGQKFPQLASVLKYDSGTITLQMNSYPKNMERLELEYIAIPTALVADSVNPTIPAQHRLCLAHLASYFMLQRNDDDRANTHLQLARDLFDELVEYNSELLSSGDYDYGRIIPNISQDTRQIVKVEQGYDESN